MKRFIGCFILLLSTFFMKAQLANQVVHDKISAILVKEYNVQNYKAIYKLLDKDFKKQMTEKELSDFFIFNVYQPYGEILKLSFSDFKSDYYLFVADCKNGKLDLQLSCSVDEKITGMQWLAHKEILPELPVLKNETVLNDNPKADAWDLKVDSIIQVYMRNGANCGLSVAIYKNKEVKFYNYGEVKRGTHQLPTQKTLYEIGSVSKTFTGILLAQAITDKKVNPNDPLRKYLGDAYKNLNYKGHEIELIHLTNHSSRIPRLPTDLFTQTNYNSSDPYANYSKEMLLKHISTLVIDTLPGVKNEYSNLAVSLLGIILEQVYTKSYEQLVKEYICQPLGMMDTHVTLSEEQKQKTASGYNGNGQETASWNLGAFVAAGGIKSTSEDMMKYVKANLEETNPALKLSHYSTFNDGKNNIAMGWHLFTTKKGNELIWHNGGTGGFTSFCGFIKSKDIGVVVLSNSANSSDQVALGILKLLQ